MLKKLLNKLCHQKIISPSKLFFRSYMIGKTLLYLYSSYHSYQIFFQNILMFLDAPKTLGIALILVRNPVNGKYLAVNQKDGSQWLPGGRIDTPELFSVGAIRQTKEEGGIDVILKGILRFQLAPNTQFIRNKIIFYAQPKDPSQKPKDFKDKESICAKYMTTEQILQLKSKWRGPELYQWATYVQKGNKIYPLQLLSEQLV